MKKIRKLFPLFLLAATLVSADDVTGLKLQVAVPLPEEISFDCVIPDHGNRCEQKKILISHEYFMSKQHSDYIVKLRIVNESLRMDGKVVQTELVPYSGSVRELTLIHERNYKEGAGILALRTGINKLRFEYYAGRRDGDEPSTTDIYLDRTETLAYYVRVKDVY